MFSVSRFDERMEEIDRWHEENPEPTGFEIACRLLPQTVRRILRPDADGYHVEGDLAEITDVLHNMWIGEMVTLHQAAEVTLPAVYDLLEAQGRTGEGEAWMKECFFDHGLDRAVAERIYREHKKSAA